jgi:transposase
VVGIDEHFFRRNKRIGRRSFVSMLTDIRQGRLLEVVDGKTATDLQSALAGIEDRDRVRFVVMDMSGGYRTFARRFFPNAQLVADKFHVLRLLSPALIRRRKAIVGHRQDLLFRRLLLCSGRSLDRFRRIGLLCWLDHHPELRELYQAKEALYALYRTRGRTRAARVLDRLTDRWIASPLPELSILARTLRRWRSEVLAYFDSGLTNAATEGLNNKAKLVKRRAFGYRSFQNYRLRLLSACAG